MLWGRVSHTSSLKRKRVGTKNKTKTSEFVVEVYQRATEYEVFDKAEVAYLAAKDGRPIEETGQV